MSATIKPTITTAKEVTTLVHNLRERAKERNQDLRTLALSKALHAFAEAKGYDNWQQYHAALIRQEFLDVQQSRYGLAADYAETAWAALSQDEIKSAESGEALADHYAKTYAVVPLGKPENASKEQKLNQSILEDLVDLYDQYSRGEDIDGLGVYGSKVTGVEVTFSMGSASDVVLLVDNERRVSAGRIETRGWGTSESLPLDADQITAVEELFRNEIDAALSGQ